MSEHTKIAFYTQQEDLTVEVETLWATPCEHGFAIDNIPFVARGFALGDVVSAKPEADGMLVCTGLVRASGHSTIRLLFARESDVPRVRERLSSMGCASEVEAPRFVAVDVPPRVAYSKVSEYLLLEEADEVLEFEESCLGTEQGPLATG